MRNNRFRFLAVGLVASAVVVATAGSGVASGADKAQDTLAVSLSGYQEDPLVLSSTGRGQFLARVDSRNQEITYRLNYSGLETAVLQAHIHFGGPRQTGGISVFLCSNLGNGPAGTQACPPAPATVTGTIRPVDIIGPANQGIAAQEFAELAAAIRAGVTYVNVHTTTFPGGEIRAQLDEHHH